MLMKWNKMLMQFFYPSRCPGCGHTVAEHGQWCDRCLADIWHPRMINRGRTVIHLDQCYCIADYRGAMRRILHRIKYDKALRYEASCQYLLERFPWLHRLAHIDYVVPVPLSPEKLHSRGFNQVERIFRPWTEENWQWNDVLQRIRPTAAQWELRRSARADNVKNVIEVKAGIGIAGKHILIVEQRCLRLIQNFERCA